MSKDAQVSSSCRGVASLYQQLTTTERPEWIQAMILTEDPDQHSGH